MERTYRDLCSKAQSMLSGPFSNNKTCLSRDGMFFKSRPCLVQRVQGNIAECFVLTTYDGTPIAQLPELMQHFSVSVGDTPPWPSADSPVIRPSPDWPKSRKTPSYLIAHTIDIPLSCLVSQYTIPSKSPPRLDGRKPRKRCYVDPEQMMLLEIVARQKEQSYKGMSFKDALKWNDSWEVNARDRNRSSPTAIQEAQNILSNDVHQQSQTAFQVHVNTDKMLDGPARPPGENLTHGSPPVSAIPPCEGPGGDGGLVHLSHPPVPPHPPSVPSPETGTLARPPSFLPNHIDIPPQPPGPLIHSQVDWVPQWSAPLGTRIHSEYGAELPPVHRGIALPPGGPEYFEPVQYVDSQPPSGFPPPHTQPWPRSMDQAPMIYATVASPPQSHFQSSVQPHAFAAAPVMYAQPNLAMNCSYAPSAPTSPIAGAYFEYATSGHLQDAGILDRSQYQQFHASAFGMHQEQPMYPVAQDNASYMPQHLRTMAHDLPMHVPELVDVAAG
ncbi:hypothetical protein AURDEDRAFT_153850 [Auricularia subglabra TFB-10046 SS5]|nr:hypothetical protein AURDEDRAFT_153850 [Auricularia subglabra TFB-10046 SS5]